MAKTGFLKGSDEIPFLPITRAELVKDSGGKCAFQSNEFLATSTTNGILSHYDKSKLDKMVGIHVINGDSESIPESHFNISFAGIDDDRFENGDAFYITFPYGDGTQYGSQIAIDDCSDPTILVRGKSVNSGGEWGPWYRVLLETDSVKNPHALTITRYAETVAEYDGSVAKTVDLTPIALSCPIHITNAKIRDLKQFPNKYNLAVGYWAGTADTCSFNTRYGTALDLSYSTWYQRLAFDTADTNGKQRIEYFSGINTNNGDGTEATLTKVGDLAYLSDIPPSLPANGGNADTVDNKHASDFVLKSGDIMTGALTIKNGANLTLQSPSDAQTDPGDIVFTGFGGDELCRLYKDPHDSKMLMRFGETGTSYTMLHSGNSYINNENRTVTINNQSIVIPGEAGTVTIPTHYGLALQSGAFTPVTYNPTGAPATVNIPTKLSQLTDDVVAGKYLRTTIYGDYNADTLFNDGFQSGKMSHIPSGSPYGIVHTLSYRGGSNNTKPDFASQIFIPCGDDSTSPNDMFFRTSLKDSWNEWNKVITDKNICNYNAGSATVLSVLDKSSNLATATYGSTAGITQYSNTDNPDGNTRWYNRLKILHNNNSGYYTEFVMPFDDDLRLGYRVYNNGTLGNWKQLAFTSDIPTSLPWDSITSKPTFAAVATTGSYNDLTNKPTIPTIPPSLPANGGNADTVDNKHASDFVLKAGDTMVGNLTMQQNGGGLILDQVNGNGKTSIYIKPKGRSTSSIVKMSDASTVGFGSSSFNTLIKGLSTKIDNPTTISSKLTVTDDVTASEYNVRINESENIKIHYPVSSEKSGLTITGSKDIVKVSESYIIPGNEEVTLGSEKYAWNVVYANNLILPEIDMTSLICTDKDRKITKYTESCGSAYKPIYLENGKFKTMGRLGSDTTGIYMDNNGMLTAMSHSLKATVNNGSKGKLAYYSSNNSIDGVSTPIGKVNVPIWLDNGMPKQINLTADSGTLYVTGWKRDDGLYTGYQTTNGVRIVGGNKVYAYQGFYESSDARLKNFKDDVTVDLEKLCSLPKKYFTWKSDNTNKLHLGTSAQELQKLYPELVESDDNGFLQVSYEKLSIIALSAIDALYQQVTILNNNNSKLEERIEQLEQIIYGKS